MSSRFTVDAKRLLAGLRMAASCAAKMVATPGLACVRMSCARGVLGLQATNFEQSIRVQVPGAKGGDLALDEVVVNVFDLISVVQRCAGDVSFGGAPGKPLKITAGRARFSLPVMAAGKLPKIDKGPPPPKAEQDVQGFLEVLKRVEYATSRDESRYNLTGCHWACDENGDLTLIATDGHRLALAGAQLPGALKPKQAVTVPNAALRSLRQVATGRPGVIWLTERALWYRAEASDTAPGVELRMQLIDGRFPDYTQVMPEPDRPALRVHKDQLLAALDVVAPLTDDGERVILNVIGVSSEGRDPRVELSSSSTRGDGLVELEAEIPSGMQMKIGARSTFLRDAARSFEGEILLEMSDGLAPILIRAIPTQDPPDAAEGRAVVMPMRI